MHDCPECGQACTCSGDIEDHDTGDQFYDDCCHDCGPEVDESEDNWTPEVLQEGARLVGEQAQ